MRCQSHFEFKAQHIDAGDLARLANKIEIVEVVAGDRVADRTYDDHASVFLAVEGVRVGQGTGAIGFEDHLQVVFFLFCALLFLLFGDKRQVELVWNGKTTETCRVVLPFQTIERVDEPRAERVEDTRRQDEMFVLDERGRQEGGWTNKLIWGDNKLILAALRSPQWREAIRAEGGLKLIYIDPPFAVGADFSMAVEVGEGGETVEKAPGVLEQIAYRDTWGQGQDSFIAMLYERLSLMRDLLADDGSIYVHCDNRVNSYIRLMMDEDVWKR